MNAESLRVLFAGHLLMNVIRPAMLTDAMGLARMNTAAIPRGRPKGPPAS